MQDCIVLANAIRKKLAVILSLQRGRFYEFGEHETEFSIFHKTENIDRSVTNNIAMERQCGECDNRLKKKPRIETVSRDIILKRIVALRDADPDPSFFRKMNSAVAK